jgi:DeoR family glycerol-3-phosphate regulon repressor
MTRRRTILKPRLRQAEISDLVLKRGEVSVEALADKFNTSAETIRRDLSALVEAGQVRKVHGGARPVSLLVEGEFETRMRRNALPKRVIADKIASLIAPSSTLFLDTGSTTLICAEALARMRELTIITNSTRIAATFARGSGGAEVYLLGGRYRADNSQTVGAHAICDIARYRADIAILTIGALDSGGAMDFSSHEAEVARAMIKLTAQVILVVDHSKFDRAASFRVCGLDEIDRLVVDKAPVASLAGALNHAEVEVI